MSQSTSPSDSLRERIESILGSKRLTLHQVSQLSKSLYGHGSAYFIPHNFYYELGRGSFTPSIYQIAALSRITDYRLRDWLGVFGFDLESIPRLQALLPAKRTILIDSALTAAESRVIWFQDKRPAEMPRIAPLTQLLERSQHKRTMSISRDFLYVQIGRQDAFAFPHLFPGSIVGLEPAGTANLVPDRNQASSRMFLIEHSKGLFCCRLRKSAGDLLIPISEKLPYGQIELRPSSEVKILATARFEIRSLLNLQHPEVPVDLARRWTPTPLEPIRNLGQLLQTGREKLDISLQAASATTRKIAEVRGDDRYFISPSSLSDYEAGGNPPRHFHKIISLCTIYGFEFSNLLEQIGISRDQLGNQAMPHELPQSRPALGTDEGIGQAADNRGFLARLLETVPDIPFFLRSSIPELSAIPEPALEDFFWIGGETDPLHPALKNSLIAIVNRRKKKPVHYHSKLFWEQPIYILLARGGNYVCACCSAEDGNLILHPYPQPTHAAVQYRNHREAEVVGQVVAVLRRL